jgi:sulfatase maturation enzyme AslB (radical SAM superfamily)
VGGEPLVRYRELSEILPRLSKMGLWVQVVTSAVRPVPSEWAKIPRLKIVVSIDGLQPEHDERRKPATYDRILKHIKGHQVTVHCTVTRQQSRREGYLEEFVRFWSENPDTGQIWISLYTPQIGEQSDERLTSADRERVVAALMHMRKSFAKLRMPTGLIEAYVKPPDNPADCIFAQTTTCVSADFQRQIAPCQFGGNPDCSNCGCIASAALKAVGRHRLPGGLRVGAIFEHSLTVGRGVRRVRSYVGS